jgi:hypothetical protein
VDFAQLVKQLQNKAPTVAENTDYLYDRQELEGITSATGALNGRAERVHLAMNNRGHYPAINGIALKEMMLEDGRRPDRDALIAKFEERQAPRKTKRLRGRVAPDGHEAVLTADGEWSNMYSNIVTSLSLRRLCACRDGHEINFCVRGQG